MTIRLFCAKCGSKLKKIKESNYFNRFSGKEFYTYIQECPKFSCESDGHDKFSEQSEKFKRIETYYKEQRKRLLKLKTKNKK